MRRWVRALTLGLVFCMALLHVAPVAFAEDQEPPTLTVAFPETRGINEVYSDGTYGGCVYDWLEEIAKYTGWKYEFVTGKPDELMDGMLKGKYDLMGSMYWMEGYDELFNYPKYIMGSNTNLIICRNENNEVKSYDYTTLEGKTIGVYSKANAKIQRLNKFLDFNNVKCRLVYFDVLAEYESCLETGKAELMLVSDVHTGDNYNVVAQFDSDPYYIVTAKQKPELCEQLSAAMEAIYSANPNFAKDLYSRYFPSRYVNAIAFTEQEQEFIRSCEPLRVAVIKDRFPFNYEKDGVAKGIVVDCLDIISQRTGLSFEFVYGESYQGLLDLVTQGKADIVGQFRNDDNSAAELGLVRTVSYAKLDSVVLCNKQSLSKTSGLVMAVPKGRDLKTSFNDDTIKYYNSYRQCIDAVSDGVADYTRIPTSFAETFTANNYYPNIAVMADAGLQEELSIALAAPVDVMLYSVLSKALNSISEKESTLLVANNNTLTLTENPFTLRTLLYSNPIMFTCISVGIILLIFAVLYVIVLGRTHTRVMQLKLDKSEAMNRAKSVFLSRMSHEIRTPMNAIIGLASLTRETGGLTSDVDQALSKIYSSAQFLMSLLNDVLDMSKIENEKMQLDSVPFNMAQMISQVEDMFSIQANSRGVKLEIDCRMQDSCFVGDKMRLQQVLTNLLANACKFTDKGSVRLTAEQRESTATTANIFFSVKDTGIGIRPEDLKNIFLAFEQTDEGLHRAQGTGLGLAISSSLVELMGGKLNVQSEYGVGSDFYFAISLPIYDAESAHKTQCKPPETQLSKLSVLLAEDNDINAEIAVELLKNRGVMVERVADGQQAVDRFAKSDPNSYDVILMDINMPIMNGLEATRKIRAMTRSDAAAVPILAMTANTFREDRDNAAEAGMTGFLPKPFDVEQLYRALLESQQNKTIKAKSDGDCVK